MIWMFVFFQIPVDTMMPSVIILPLKAIRSWENLMNEISAFINELQVSFFASLAKCRQKISLQPGEEDTKWG